MEVQVRVEGREVIPLGIPMRGGRYQGVLLELRGEGLTGLGEAPVLPGRGPSLEELLVELRADRPPGSAVARCAWATALLDLEGKARGLSLAELLGGRRRDRVRCNALIEPASAAAVAAEIGEWRDRGFADFKLKAANQGGPVDLERLGAARWACGREGRLRIDFNAGLSLAQAEVVLPSLARFGLDLVEQPLPAAAPGPDWVGLQSVAGVALAADESLADPALASELAELGVGLAIKLATVGGPRAALGLAGRSGAALVFASAFETSVGLAAALQTACASPTAPLACGLATAGLLEADPASGLAWDGAELLLPGGPGLGVELDLELLRFYRLDR